MVAIDFQFAADRIDVSSAQPKDLAQSRACGERQTPHCRVKLADGIGRCRTRHSGNGLNDFPSAQLHHVYLRHVASLRTVPCIGLQG